MWLTDDEDELFDQVVEHLPRAPARGLRKLSDTVAVRATFDMWNGPSDKRRYEVEVWYVETKNGARWVKAETNSGTHRAAITKVKTMMRMARLQGLVE